MLKLIRCHYMLTVFVCQCPFYIVTISKVHVMRNYSSIISKVNLFYSFVLWYRQVFFSSLISRKPAFRMGTSAAAAQVESLWFLNPNNPSGLSNPFHLDESTLIFRGINSIFFIFISFFDEIPESKQKSPRWDAAFCGVTFGAILFANVP